MKTDPPFQRLTPSLGNCGICGKGAIINARCPHTGIEFGKCCIEAMWHATAAIDRAVRKDGWKHPQPK